MLSCTLSRKTNGKAPQRAFSDADHAGCLDTCKSTSGGIQFLGDKLVSWMSKKQDCTAMSSAEANTPIQSTSMSAATLSRNRVRENRVNILKSIDEGPFKMGTMRVIVAKGTEGSLNLGPERPRVYSDLSQDEKDRDSSGRQIEEQGNNARVQVQLVLCLGGSQNRVGMLNPDKMLLMQAQENGVVLDEEQLLFLASGHDNAIDEDMVILNRATNLVCDEAGPSYDSDILSEVHDHDHFQDAICEHHEDHGMQDDV
ncbi:hypothetical protein Tco_1133090 [Tanacetum coccineum]|uniref:Uncharacterized protein n=1 Tax=Tanacetum coccineum TaxID=301880 RepID=A0ABQ5JHR6_9ASTR